MFAGGAALPANIPLSRLASAIDLSFRTIYFHYLAAKHVPELNGRFVLDTTGEGGAMADGKQEKEQKDPKDQLVETLGTLARIVVGEEFEAVEEAMDSLEARLSKKIEKLSSEMSSRIDAAEKKLTKKIEEVSKSLDAEKSSRTKAHSELDSRLSKAVSDLKDEVKKTRERARTDLEALCKELDEQTEEQQDQIEGQFEEVRNALEQLGQESRKRKSEGRKVAAALANFAQAFAAQDADAGTARPSAPRADTFRSPSSSGTGDKKSAPQAGKNAGKGKEENLPQGGDLEKSIDELFSLGPK